MRKKDKSNKNRNERADSNSILLVPPTLLFFSASHPPVPALQSESRVQTAANPGKALVLSEAESLET